MGVLNKIKVKITKRIDSKVGNFLRSRYQSFNGWIDFQKQIV